MRRQRQDAAVALEIDVVIAVVGVVDGTLDGRQHGLGTGQVFGIGHAKLYRFNCSGTIMRVVFRMSATAAS